MRKPPVLPTLALLEALALLLGGLYWFGMRPDLLAAYGAVDVAGVPWATRLALSYFAPAIGLSGAACVVAAFVLRVGARTRTSLAAAGLVATAFALAFALIGAWAPAFGG
jgi:hypothetical protein